MNWWGTGGKPPQMGSKPMVSSCFLTEKIHQSIDYWYFLGNLGIFHG